jgi:hypothetical protein
MRCSYKGMFQTTPSTGKPASPQVTGFSQIQNRTLGGGDGGSMSVLLSWHEKVRLLQDIYLRSNLLTCPSSQRWSKSLALAALCE